MLFLSPQAEASSTIILVSGLFGLGIQQTYLLTIFFLPLVLVRLGFLTNLPVALYSLLTALSFSTEGAYRFSSPIKSSTTSSLTISLASVSKKDDIKSSSLISMS